VRSQLTVAFAFAVLLSPASSSAKRMMAPHSLEGLEQVIRVAPKSGFIASSMAFSRTGTFLAYVETDSATRANLRVFHVGKRTHLRNIDLSKLSTNIVGVRFATDMRIAVLSRSADGAMRAGITHGHGLHKTFGPHHQVTFADKGKRVLLRTEEVKSLTDGTTKHEFNFLDASSGRRAGRKRTLILDDIQRSKKLGLRLVYWRDGGRVAVGIKEGVYSPKLDQKLPSTESWYDLLAGRFIANKVIKDFVAHRKLMDVMKAHGGQGSFAVVARDLSSVKVSFGAALRSVKLVGAPMHHYDLKSLQSQELSDGSVLFSLTIDPVHPDAAAKRRAVPVWLDFYRVNKGQAVAQRVGRIRLSQRRKRSWVATPSHVAVLTRHKTFGSGGPELNVYRFR
jgi:hypothetical protein